MMAQADEIHEFLAKEEASSLAQVEDGEKTKFLA